MIDKNGFHFTYDGENSKSHKLVVTGVDDYALPQKKVITYDIDGRDGSLLYDTKAFENTPYNKCWNSKQHGEHKKHNK